jgi:chromosome segregation ATPase
VEAYQRVNETATAKAIEEAEQRIQALNEQIEQLRADISTRTQALSELGTAAQVRKSQIQQVLDFFQPT